MKKKNCQIWNTWKSIFFVPPRLETQYSKLTWMLFIKFLVHCSHLPLAGLDCINMDWDFGSLQIQLKTNIWLISFLIFRLLKHAGKRWSCFVPKKWVHISQSVLIAHSMAISGVPYKSHSSVWRILEVCNKRGYWTYVGIFFHKMKFKMLNSHKL